MEFELEIELAEDAHDLKIEMAATLELECEMISSIVLSDEDADVEYGGELFLN